MDEEKSIPIKIQEQMNQYVLQQGKLQLRNPHIKQGHDDILYHIALGNKTHDLERMFQDVKFVCLGGSPNRMHQFAEYLMSELDIEVPAGLGLTNIACGSDRYVLYKVGPVLSVSHGMGIPSLSILFHELVKLLHHAGCSDVTFFRLGTSGGLGIEPGSLVITEEAVNGLLQPYMEVATLGKLVQHPSRLDSELAQQLLALAQTEPQCQGHSTYLGKTMCTLDFYEGQARLDGAFCDYQPEDKMAFLKRIHNHGIRNIEMESLCFASYCQRAGVKGAVVCVTLLDRLKGDQVSSPHNILEDWQRRPQRLVALYIKQHLGGKKQ
ncbi:uridine phosphorylase [Plakobranchus ocellatus]|uniref:Uridine phosphorylase n=1 Tax=Plakobranchus ocellatus TaxID=259542 RepID=A0AAV4BK24_9GAST|nr:uridine phosphorylase [Plakobranchus ocellatus]